MIRTRTQIKAETSNGIANGKTNGANGTSVAHHKTNGVSVSANETHSGFLFKFISPLVLILLMPNFTLALWYTETKCDGSFMKFLLSFQGKSIFEEYTNILWSISSYLSQFSITLILSFAAVQLFLMRVIPGKTVWGPITPKGNIPKYTDNGFSIYIINLVLFAIATVTLKQYGYSPSIVYDRFGEILCTLNVLSLLFCILLLFKGLYAPSTTDCGTSGSFIFDYYWGTELYPCILGWDVKVFTNCRFGLMVWSLFTWIFAIKSYELYGFVDSMFVSLILQTVYLTKFFWWEAGYMRTIDIMLDRAGYYICWGCLVYVPSLYTSPTFYLVNHPVKLGPVLATSLLCLGLASVFVNYFADWQKLKVRETDGNCQIWGKKPEVIRARYHLESGEEKESILLVSGYWGLARHFHYVPELLLAFCWSIPALFENVFPYMYFLFILILLIHRTYRDDDKCSKKYGYYWQEYCRKVPCRIIPFVY